MVHYYLFIILAPRLVAGGIYRYLGEKMKVSKVDIITG